MSTRSKKLVTVGLVVIGIYALTPFVAGLLKTDDRRGPRIFVESHHELLYRFGYYIAGHHHHDGKPRVPYMQERSWFYGIQGERMPERQIREKLEVLSQQR
jgi:hypothetical protein